MSITPKKISKKELLAIWSQVPADYYDKGISENILQRLWHQKKLSEILSFVPKKPVKVLDVGCSSGIITHQVHNNLPKRSKVHGIDSYKAAVDLAKTKYPHISFAVADAHKLPFKNKYFDLVICTETLEHVTNPQGVLSEIKRVLKKDNILRYHRLKQV